MAFKYLLLAVVLCGTAWAQSEPTNEEIKDALQKLSPELQGKVNETVLQDIGNKSQQIFKEKCEKNGGAAAFEAAQKAYKEFPDCVQQSLGLTDPEAVKLEIAEAKPRGVVDEVFKKYCSKAPKAKECFKTMTESVKPCFSAEEQKNLKTVYNITEQLVEFICFKDGDRIALFIAEGGPECFESKKEDIQECVSKTFGNDYKFDPNDISSTAPNNIPEIAFGEKECSKLTELQKCVVGSLETCSAPTSANIVESLFKFARSATPCKHLDKGVGEPKPRSQEIETSDKGNSATGLAVTSMTVVIAVVTTLF